MYLDIWGTIHVELHHSGFDYTHSLRSMWDFLFARARFYKNMPKRMIACSRSVTHEDIIGARQLMYFPEIFRLVGSGTGLLTWDEICNRGDTCRSDVVSPVRRSAYRLFEDAANLVAAHLGAHDFFGVTEVIDDEKMQALGWQPYITDTWSRKLFKALLSFPTVGSRAYVRQFQTAPQLEGSHVPIFAHVGDS